MAPLHPFSLHLLLLQSTISIAIQHGPFTNHFVRYLSSNPMRNEYILSAYREYDETGTFGGVEGEQEISRQPVIFVHGNSDSALFHSETATGWTKHVEYFKKKGYNSAELYGLTYGDRNIMNSIHNRISCRNVLGIRRFIEAVVSYTQASKVDVIAHSMGVTLVRKAIQGGRIALPTENCDLGPPLNNTVDTLLAISSANRGMCMCLMTALKATNACSPQDGYWPGECGNTKANEKMCAADFAECDKSDYADVLKKVNDGLAKETSEADFIVSMWSRDDPVLGKDNFVWGRKTSIVPYSNVTIELEHLDHTQTKDNTVHDQYLLVTQHNRHSTRTTRALP